MKVKILKKSIKEGDTIDGRHYSIKSLCVNFTDAEIYAKIVANLKAQGCTEQSIEKFCSPSEYKGETSYTFWMNASNFTFERVQQFGVLDAKITFSQNDKGFINAKIHVIDKKEQVDGYEAPEQAEEEVVGWSTNAPEPKSYGDGSKGEPIEVADLTMLGNPESNSLEPQVTDLPF